MLSHKNLLAFARTAITHSELQLNNSDVYASYLPLPHVMERFVTGALFAFGAHVMYNIVNLDVLVEMLQN